MNLLIVFTVVIALLQLILVLVNIAIDHLAVEVLLILTALVVVVLPSVYWYKNNAKLKNK